MQSHMCICSIIPYIALCVEVGAFVAEQGHHLRVTPRRSCHHRSEPTLSKSISQR